MSATLDTKTVTQLNAKVDVDGQDYTSSQSLLREHKRLGMSVMTEKTMIQFENVSKVYGEKTVVQPLDVSIQKGEFITILGTSGSGKTTLLKMINKLIEPTTGKVFFDGQDIAQMNSVALRRQIGYVV